MAGKRRLLVLGAHPDDAEYHAGGLIAEYVRRGHDVKMVSVTDGGAGHHWREPRDLVNLRRQEAQAAGDVLGIPYETWDFPDGQLQPTLEVRQRIITEIRTYQPDLVLTHRPCDYHPDHRAVGQAVQDASYLLTVPLVMPHVQALRRDPIVAYMCDLFTKPYPLEPQVVLDISAYVDVIVEMLACHASQLFEWLPYNQGVEAEVPHDADQRKAWLRAWYVKMIGLRADRFGEALRKRYGGQRVEFVEAYEISEYAGKLSAEVEGELFPETRR